MNYKNKLNQIRVVLGLQIKLASEKLVDGKTVVEAEEFAPGMDLMVVAEDGSKSPAPAGEHVTESGLKVKVDDAGKIVSVEKAEAESEEPKVEIEVEQASKPVKMAEEEPIDGSEPEAPKEEDAVEEKIAEVMKKVMAAMEPMIEEITEMKSKIAKMEEQYSKFAKAPAAGKISTLNTQAEKAETVDIVERFKLMKKDLR
ncbi:MAG: hypothetical protein ACO3EY_03580 [Candidatus Nanopelagicales bacterium]